MLIDTVRFSHLLGEDKLHHMAHFLAHTAFVISHKSESIETLLGVLWYLPTNSPTIVVTNCPEQHTRDILYGIQTRLTSHKNIYVVHQKDEQVARFFQEHGVAHILGDDGLVRNGKGEGMYIGTLCASLLRYSQWVVFYDADNLVPCALLEYTLAMGRLFLAARSPNLSYLQRETVPLHNIRICWASKPSLQSGKLEENLLGRCTRVISPIFQGILEEWFGIGNHPVISSNAGEQGMAIQTAEALRFSSGFSVETFQLLDFLFKAAQFDTYSGEMLLQQYQSQSPHFHTKREDGHIKDMIAVSLGGFFAFQGHLPPRVEEQVLRLRDELSLDVTYPLVYPALQSLDLVGDEEFLQRYRLFDDTDNRDAWDSLLETIS